MYCISLSFKLSRISWSFCECLTAFFKVISFGMKVGSFLSGRGFIRCLFGFTCGLMGPEGPSSKVYIVSPPRIEDLKVTNLGFLKVVFIRLLSSFS